MKAAMTSFLLVSLVALSSFSLDAQNAIDKVIAAMRSGNSAELSKYFDDNVEISLPGKSDSYSKAQAQVILRDFFGNNAVQGFELKHKGDAPGGGGQFCVGTLKTKSGNYRAHVFMKPKSNKEVVEKIRLQLNE
ncbi:MAG TPA: DUF4783 domain-containing protein [Chitinophagaceae bacterium]|nr:DUF4783 domain-containing protein [Chitinophagaceae bacterium]